MADERPSWAKGPGTGKFSWVEKRAGYGQVPFQGHGGGLSADGLTSAAWGSPGWLAQGLISGRAGSVIRLGLGLVMGAEYKPRLRSVVWFVTKAGALSLQRS